MILFFYVGFPANLIPKPLLITFLARRFRRVAKNTQIKALKFAFVTGCYLAFFYLPSLTDVFHCKKCFRNRNAVSLQSKTDVLKNPEICDVLLKSVIFNPKRSRRILKVVYHIWAWSHLGHVI